MLVDWLPWNHTFGGNHNFNLVLRNGGTLYVDGGKPVPGLVETTVRNLKEVAPTMYFNVPRGYDLLLPFLESDAELRRNFFRDLQVVFYAAAALPQNLWDRLLRLARQEKGDGELAMLSAWGSTETAPLATSVHFQMERPGVIGLPVAGCELKLVPSGGKLEVRVRGTNVTPGYYKRPDLTAAAFDEEGFYRIGDAVKLADAADPAKGIVFDGRVVEDFKLSTGTWVNVGLVRVKLIAAADPIVQDAVITGHDRSEVGALVFLSAAAKEMKPEEIRSRLVRRPGKAEGRRRKLDPSGAPSRPERAAVDRRERDHRQGLRQPARGARAARRAGGTPLRRGRSCDFGYLLETPSHTMAPTVRKAPATCSGVTVCPRISQARKSSAIGSMLSAAVVVEGSRGSTKKSEIIAMQ